MVVLLAISLLFVQAIQLHMHLYDHQHDGVEYAHQSIPHSGLAHSEVEHHDGAITVEPAYYFSNRSMLAKLLFSPVFTVILLIILPIFLNRSPWRIVNFVLPSPKRYSLGPPLRAPPLH